MGLTSSVYTAYSLPSTTDEEGGEHKKPGYRHVGTTPTSAEYPEPRLVIHAAPGMPIPDDALAVTVDGSQTEWLPSQMAAAHPTDAPYVLDAEYWADEEDAETGETVRVLRRCKVVEVPDGAEVHRTNLVPHLWAGESLEPEGVGNGDEEAG